MRLGRALAVAVACLGACHVYDPVDEIHHREYPDARSAVSAILAEVGDARVYAVGEYHPSRRTVAQRSPIARFTHEILELLVPASRDLVLEAWLDQRCSTSSQAVAAEVAATLGRPPSTTAELEALILKQAHGVRSSMSARELQLHGLPVTCLEHEALRDATGRVDFLRLLLLVTEKLGTTTRRLVHEDRTVIVYGGALHNDLYPRWPLEELSYAYPLAKELGGGVVELDLVVPEVVAPMPLIRNEDWFPLLGRATPERVIVWQRGPASYVVILPAHDYETRKVALPVAAL